ncbi:MAG: 16S rRNA (adenine(1518)-N(6)/adenine(1519)-N(6))-dimethyltransferase RsmA [Alkalispirochaetaceae bacterium]
MSRRADEVDLASPRDINSFLEERGITLKKRWGQNFLFQERYRRWIVDLLAPLPGERIWEIGPGIGALTDELVASGARLTLFEIDHGLIELLSERFGEGVEIVAGDAVKRCREALDQGPPPSKVVGNLPYSSGSRIIASFVESNLARVPPMVVMVQREVAQRMVAEAGGQEYSSFTVLIGSCYTPRLEGEVPADAFTPSPRVRSTVVRLEPREDALPPPQRIALSTVARALFSSRRKTVRNCLRRNFDGPQVDKLTSRLEELGYSPDSRGEELSTDVYAALARRLLEG